MHFGFLTLLYSDILDLLAVPDFQSGAMEDWGLISFRSALLVFDQGYSTAEYRRTGALVIAHELAHQVSKQFAS